MIKKSAKFVMILIMIVGIAFSVLTFFPIEVETVGNDGHTETVGGSTLEECYPPGNECIVNMFQRI